MFTTSHRRRLINIIVPFVPALVAATLIIWLENVNPWFNFRDFWHRLFVDYLPFFSWFMDHSPRSLNNLISWLRRPIKLFKPCQTAHTRQAWAFIIPGVILRLYNRFATPRHLFIFFPLNHVSCLCRQRRSLTECLLKSLRNLFCSEDAFAKFSFGT